MKSTSLNLLIILFLTAAIGSCKEKSEKYTADWSSLEQVEPVPEWFKDAKFGIYFHWGVYSVPAFGNEWYPRRMYVDDHKVNLHHIENYGQPEEWPYHYFITGAEDKQGNFVQFAPRLKSEGGRFDPEEWADLFAASGAKFAGPVAEHHDGFSMWASDINPWNAKDKGPELDLVGLLADAIREREMKVILSMHHAFHGFIRKIGGSHNNSENEYFYFHAPDTDDPELQILYGKQSKEENEKLWLGKHKEIIDKYQPDIIWQDFNLNGIKETVLLEFLAYYYNKAEEWNREVVATYKDGLNTDVAVLDYERGGPVDITDYYWLTDDAISRTSWCYTEGISYYSPKKIFHGFLDRVSKNGNLLLNISPMADGTIPQEQKEILLAFGDWLGKYGEAVYNTRPWVKYGEGPTKMGTGHRHTTEDKVVEFEAPIEGTAKDIRFTRSKNKKVLYAIMLGWPGYNETLSLQTLSSQKFSLQSLEHLELLGNEKNKNISLRYEQDDSGLHITMPEKQSEELAYVIKLVFSNEIPDLI